MLLVAALFIQSGVAADPPERWEPEWGLGARLGLWAAEEAAPQLGGQIALRPARWIEWLAFNDNSARAHAGVAQLDHVIGFHAVLPMVHWSDGFVGASMGSCVDFRTWRDAHTVQPIRTDVLFGPRLGVHVEHRIEERWTVQATVTGMVYVGNTHGTYQWGAASTGLRANPVVQGQIGLTRWFAARN